MFFIYKRKNWPLTRGIMIHLRGHGRNSLRTNRKHLRQMNAPDLICRYFPDSDDIYICICAFWVLFVGMYLWLWSFNDVYNYYIKFKLFFCIHLTISMCLLFALCWWELALYFSGGQSMFIAEQQFSVTFVVFVLYSSLFCYSVNGPNY